jgi:homoprotocatechuate degradation regulator HpaR
MSALTEALPVLLLKARENSLACVRPILQDHGLTEPQWRVLQTLHERPNLSAQALAEHSCILSPSLSRILSRFAADNLILRNVSNTDQRAVSIRLSAKGKRLCERVLPKLTQRYRMLQEQRGEEQIRLLADALQEFISTPVEATET